MLSKNDDLQARTELAKIYQRQGKLQEAEKVLMDLLAIDRRNLQARTELAKIYQRQGKLQEAEKVLMDLLAIEKDDLQARTELAKIYQRQGKLTEAERYLKEYIALDKNGLHPRTELAKIYQRQGKLDEADKMVQEAMAIDNRNCFAMAEFISICNNKNEPVRCLQTFDDFLSRVSLGKGREHQAMFNNIFKLCERFNRKDAAAEYFHKYFSVLDDQNINLYHRLFH